MKIETDAKRARVLNAALECFKLYGLKRTAMEDIAQKAGISRAALYLLFPNKEAIFVTGLEILHTSTLAQVQEALAEQGSFDARLITAFESKHLGFLELVISSPHGAELLDEHHGLGAELSQQAEQRFVQMLTLAFQQAEERKEISLAQSGLDTQQAATLLNRSVRGLKQPPVDIERYRQELAQLVHIFYRAIATI